jgi:adenylate cyclase
MTAPGPPGPDQPDVGRLNQLLVSLGGTAEDIATAEATNDWGAIALELALAEGRAPMTLAETAEQMGESRENIARFWQALGLTDPRGETTRISAELADAQAIVSRAVSQWLGDEVALGIARVVGAATARLAEAVVDAFRMGFEVPELAAGTSYAEVVERYIALTKESLPPFQAMVGAVLKAHLVRVAAGAWAPDVASAGTRRDVAIGFADLVGYTALSRTLPPGELAVLLTRFEDVVADVLSEHRGRLVKLVGDGAMFTAADPDVGCALAFDLAQRFAAAEKVPPVRVGLASGSVLTLYGDYYGAEVNLAARLVALANPGTVVVSEQVCASAGAGWRFEQLPPAALKGFGAPETVFRLLGPA